MLQVICQNKEQMTALRQLFYDVQIEVVIPGKGLLTAEDIIVLLEMITEELGSDFDAFLNSHNDDLRERASVGLKLRHMLAASTK